MSNTAGGCPPPQPDNHGHTDEELIIPLDQMCVDRLLLVLRTYHAPLGIYHAISTLKPHLVNRVIHSFHDDSHHGANREFSPITQYRQISVEARTFGPDHPFYPPIYEIVSPYCEGRVDCEDDEFPQTKEIHHAVDTLTQWVNDTACHRDNSDDRGHQLVDAIVRDIYARLVVITYAYGHPLKYCDTLTGVVHQIHHHFKGCQSWSHGDSGLSMLAHPGATGVIGSYLDSGFAYLLESTWFHPDVIMTPSKGETQLMFDHLKFLVECMAVRDARTAPSFDSLPAEYAKAITIALGDYVNPHVRMLLGSRIALGFRAIVKHCHSSVDLYRLGRGLRKKYAHTHH